MTSTISDIPPVRTPLVHIMCGLPGSGKTTEAYRLLAQANGLMRRSSLDDLRAMLDRPGTAGRPVWSHAHEQTTLRVQDETVRAAVLDGYDVVVDNTHLTPNHPTRLKAAVGRIAWFVVHDLTSVPVEECIRRDAERPEPIGADVIRALAADHARALATGWSLTDTWMNDQHTATAGGIRWARNLRKLTSGEDNPA